jgi:putative tryptophan/tyrosine transport system substrate-binding protein
MRRRKFITLLGASAAAGWPLAVRAQQRGYVRHIGVLMNLAADDPESQVRMNAFVERLQQFGWTAGLNVQIDTRWAAGDPERFRRYAEELVGLAPDAILASTSESVAALQHASRAVPIVFANVTDPVGQGFVASLARPGGNATGFSVYEYGIAPKWLELLRDITPGVRRVAVLRDAAFVANGGLLGAIQGVASSFALEVIPLGVRDPDEIERGIAAFAARPTGGLIVLASTLSAVPRKPIIAQAAKHKLAAIFTLRFYVAAGGLVSYGPDAVDLYRRAASYVDRILKGEKPADLPVQAPTKYELVINLKTAKALGLKVPDKLLALADDVIE